MGQKNFGCGSSRNAPIAKGFRVSCVIAEALQNILSNSKTLGCQLLKCAQSGKD